MSFLMQGVPVSSGVALGSALKFESAELTPDTAKLSEDMVDAEKQRIKDAIDGTNRQIEELIETVGDSEKSEILEAHLSILHDPYFKQKILHFIEKDLCNAEMALSIAVREIGEEFEALDDEYLRERVADFKDVGNRIMHILQGVPLVNLTNLSKPVVIVAKDLSPSQTAVMDFKKVLGFATDLGGRTSHTAIMARNMDIPAVVGYRNLFEQVKNGDFIILDGDTGQICLNPPEDEIKTYEEKQAKAEAEKLMLEKLKDEDAKTTDGHFAELCANIGNTAEAQMAAEKGADGVGLFRTEFLYMESKAFPTEDEQFATYKDVAVAMNGKPVIIRTLDIGGDKSLEYYKFDPELNPFLGYRAIRLCLDRTDIFKTQLRAILRASAFGKLRIMYPMIISLEELLKCNEILEICKAELKNEGHAIDERIETGIMIETPAAVWMADTLAKHVDFFSIGTNDLTQYTLAVDRGNEKIQELYNPLNPAVLRSIYHVIQASHEAGKWTGMCGEFAGDVKAIPVLLGMGLDEFSMNASSILKAKQAIRNLSFAECRDLAERVLKQGSVSEIEKAIAEKY